MTGFVSFERYLWRQATLATQQLRAVYRVLQWLLPLGVALLFEYGTYQGFMESDMLANIGVAMIVLPLFDEAITNWGYAWRGLGVMAIWGLQRGSTASHNWPLLVLLLVNLLLIRHAHRMLRHTPHWMFVITVSMVLSFWLDLTWAPFTVQLVWQAAGMYFVICTFVALFWARTHRQFLLDQRMQALIDYDDVVNDTTVAQDRAVAASLFRGAQVHHEPLTVAAFDVDHFKQFNQAYGHMAGNATLMAVTQTLRQVLDQKQVAYQLNHLGGEEFSLLLPKVGLAQAITVVNQCLTQVRTTAFPVEHTTAQVTLSAGVTTLHEQDQSVDSLYKRADDSLYISKIHGHDVLTVEGQTTTYDRDVDVNQLAYFAQPIEGVNAQGSVHWAAELLLRRYDSQSDQWRLPARFDIAVDKQIILISQALTVLNVQRVNVNLTLAQFSDIETAKSLVSYMHSGRGPQQLTIEITDVPSVTVMRRVSALYREAGILIYIDDVGSDNSYELVQKLLPYVNGVKFAIQNLRRQESSARIHERIQFWLDIAQHQEISFILEGLEFPDEVTWAQHLGIQYFQGYYFGKPQLPLTA